MSASLGDGGALAQCPGAGPGGAIRLHGERAGEDELHRGDDAVHPGKEEELLAAGAGRKRHSGQQRVDQSDRGDGEIGDGARAVGAGQAAPCPVEAERAVGNPHWRIAVRHILPNVMPQLLVQATLTVATAIIAEASLSFLGLGQQPPAPSWGSMLNTAQRFLATGPWMAVFPGLAIFVTVLSFNLLGDGLRDALDPRAK